MNSDAYILIVSKDQMLLHTRKLILGSYFQVETAGRVSLARSLIAQQTFDLIILCHTLSEGERQQVIGLVDEQNPRPKVLTLSALGYYYSDTGTGPKFMTEDGPFALIKKSAELLGFNLNSGDRLAQG